MLIDIGVNLTHRAFHRDLEHVLERAGRAGVPVLIVTGTTVAGSREARHLAERYPGRLFATAGVHPHHAKDYGNLAHDALRELAMFREVVVAIGECGLDYNRDFSPRPDQNRAFEAQLELAAECEMPVFLHQRDAHGTFVCILQKHRPRLVGGVVHCFTGDARELAEYLELDLHIGITGWICDERRGLHLREVVRQIPLDRLMLETDAPYLLPRTLTNKPPAGRNEPAFLVEVLRTVSSSLGIDETEITRQTTENARRLFRMPI